MKTSFKVIPRRVYVRYGLLMVPEALALALILIFARRWALIPFWLIGIIVFLWLVKDMIMFPFVWRAYDSNRPGFTRPAIGERGIAHEPLMPTGYIRVGGELWLAEKIGNGPPVQKGEFVRVTKMEGLKLYVVPDSPDGKG